MYKTQVISEVQFQYTDTQDDHLYMSYCLYEMIELREKVTEVCKKMACPYVEIAVEQSDDDEAEPVTEEIYGCKMEEVRDYFLVKFCKKEIDKLGEAMETCAELFGIDHRTVTFKFYKPGEMLNTIHNTFCGIGIFINN